jgi:hypothetical protein
VRIRKRELEVMEHKLEAKQAELAQQVRGEG